MTDWRIENCVIYVCVTAALLGLYAMSGSWLSLNAMWLLLFVNGPAQNKPATREDNAPPPRDLGDTNQG